MVDIRKFSNSAGGNNSASPDGFPEGMAPSGVNDSARELMAAVRRWYEDAEWRSFDDSPAQESSTSFTLPTNLTDRYHDGRRVRFAMENADTLYATVTSASFSSNTRVSVDLDQGSLSSSISAVAVGWAATNQSQPQKLGFDLDGGGNAVVNSPFATVTRTGSDTLTAGDAGKLILVDDASTATLSIPDNGSVPLAVGTTVSFLQTGDGQVRIDGSGSTTVRDANGTLTQAKWSLISAIKIDINEWVVVGDTIG